LIAGIIAIATQTQKVKTNRSKCDSNLPPKNIVRAKTNVEYNGPISIKLIQDTHLKKYDFSTKYLITEKTKQMFISWCQENGKYFSVSYYYFFLFAIQKL
jgi:hypothetical protein